MYWDVVDLDVPDMVRGCDEDLLEAIAIDSLPAEADGTRQSEGFSPGRARPARARIDSDTKVRAIEAPQTMGLSVPAAIRLLLLRVANEKRCAEC